MDNRFLVLFFILFSSVSYAADDWAAIRDPYTGEWGYGFTPDGACSAIGGTLTPPVTCAFSSRGSSNVNTGTCPESSPYFNLNSGACEGEPPVECEEGLTERLYGSFLNSSAVSADDCGVPYLVTKLEAPYCKWTTDVQGGWQVALNGSLCEWWSDATSTGQVGDPSSGYTASSAADGPTEPSTGGEGGDAGIGGGDDGSDDGTGDNDGAGDSGDADGSDSGGDTGSSDGSDSGNGDTSGGSSGGSSGGGSSGGAGTGTGGDSDSGDGGSGKGGDTGDGSFGDGSGDSGDGSGGGDTGDSGDSGDSDGGDNTGGDGSGGSGDDTGDSGDGDSDNGGSSGGSSGSGDGDGGSGECNPETEDCSDEPSGDCDPSSEECCDSETEECGDGGDLDYRNCSADFVCDGDALQCAQLEVEHASLCLMSESEYQDFLNSSEIKGDGTEISETGVLNALDGGTVDISDALNLSDIFNVSTSASCPEFPTVDTSYGSYSVDTTDNFCQYANTVRPFVIYMVSFFASLLVLRGITS